MGKRHKSAHVHKSKKSKTFSEFEEREKIKESILKVFRARLRSPEKGGALLVGPTVSHRCSTAGGSKGTTDHARRKQASPVGVPKTSDDSSDSMSDRGTKSRTKRRKKGSKPTQNKPKAEKETTSAVSNHIKVAHGITYGRQYNPDAVTDKDISSMISQSRMTRLGLFRQGKKSSAALRDPVTVPMHIQEQTEKDLRAIVDHSDFEVQKTAGLAEIHRALLKKDTNVVVNKVSTPDAVEMRSIPNTCVASIKSCSSELEKDTFPVVLQKRETVGKLVSALKAVNKKMYPGRNLQRERTEELMKLMKQNAPRSATPTPSILLKRHSASNSVQRSLVQQFPPEDSGNDGHPSSRHNHDRIASKADETSDMLTVNGTKGKQRSVIAPGPNISRRPTPVGYEPMETDGFKDSLFSLNSSDNRYSMIPQKQSHRKPIILQKSQPAARSRNAAGKCLGSGSCNDRTGTSHSREGGETASWDRDLSNLQKYDWPLSNSDAVAGMGGYRSVSTDASYFDAVPHSAGTSRSTRSSYNIDMLLHSAELLQQKENIRGQPSDGDKNRHLNFPSQAFVEIGHDLLNQPTSKRQDDPNDILRGMHSDQSAIKNQEIRAMELRAGEMNAVQLLQQGMVRQDCDPGTVYSKARDAGVLCGPSMVTEYGDSLSRTGSQCSHCSHSSVQSTTRTAGQVLARDQHEYMPSFHGDYYKDHCRTEDLTWRVENHKRKVEPMESMDILDYIDRGSVLEQFGRGLPHSPRTKTILHAASPDSDGSPLWNAPDQILLPQKPPINTPGSGPKLYPRRLY